VQHRRPLFNGNISVGDCMPLPSLLKTIKITGGVEFTWCMKNSLLSMSVWSITAGSNVPSTLGWYASYRVNPRRVFVRPSALHASVLAHLSRVILRKY